MNDGQPYAAEPGGVRLSVRVTPRANRHALNGIIGDAEGRPCLAVRLAAPPVEGAANKALIRFLADALGLRASDIHVRSGGTARVKILFIAGDSTALLARLAAWLRVEGVD
ncbi:DUF167 domain-containing protein [Acidisoma sp.]|uniref:DUF167 domain-containing protein n=1 Tax=Acidisoma sp. TaxID=1872115 RepID=UPI003AFFAEC2